MIAPPLLQVRNVSLSYGGLQALDRCDLTIEPGTLSGLIGPNGAGKSSLINVISGTIRPSEGTILFQGEDISSLSRLQRARLGIFRTYQIPREFGALSVLENLLVVYPNRFGERLFDAIFAVTKARTHERLLVEQACEILEMFGLYSVRHEAASSLSGGAKRLLELARAVMARPKLLLMDEPMAGVAPALLDRLGNHLLHINVDLGVTLVLVEHRLEIVERICDRVVVLAAGKNLAEGTMEALRHNEQVIEAYLGTGVTRERP